MSDDVPVGTDKVSSKKCWEVDSELGEDMKGIMYMIAHRLDTLEKKGQWCNKEGHGTTRGGYITSKWGWVF